MNRPLYRLVLALLGGYLLVALAAGYWSVVRAPDLLTRADNPRIVLQRQETRRGDILDRDGAVLATSVTGAEPGTWQRQYLLPAAAPATGYYSLRHGAGQVEATYDDVLMGLEGRDASTRFLDNLLHRAQAGRSVRLTLDSGIQQAAEAALNGRAGAIVVLGAGSGEILALASHPAYDPNELEAQFESLAADPAAPLVNRTTQGSYQPGPVLQPALMAFALQRGTIAPGEVITASGLPIDLGISLSCGDIVGMNLAPDEALAYACPGYFAEIGRRMEPAELDRLFETLGFFAAPRLPLAIAVPERIAVPADATGRALAVTGQGALTVTPLHVALVTAALAREGVMPAPRLVEAVQLPDDQWASVLAESGNEIFAPAAAEQVRAWLQAAAAGDGPAGAARVSGSVIAGHAGVALSGVQLGVPEGLSWFTGFIADGRAGEPIVVTVLIEHNSNARAAAAVAQAVFRALASPHSP